MLEMVHSDQLHQLGGQGGGDGLNIGGRTNIDLM